VTVWSSPVRAREGATRLCRLLARGRLWRAAPASLSARRNQRRGKGGAGPGDQGRAREVVDLEANRRKKKGEEKKEGKRKGRKEKKKRIKGNKKKENKRRKIEKRFRKLGEISRKIRRRVFADFSGFLGYQCQFRDGGDGEADRPAGPRRCGILVVVADRGAGAARVGDGSGAGGAGGIHGTRAEGKRIDRGFERG
jgi:hypothetical protein